MMQDRPGTANDAIARLKTGNDRFTSGHPTQEPLRDRVAELKDGQSPFAVVLGCSDSRVPVEIVFDQRPGDLFVVRIAGNYITDSGLGTIEYAIAVLKSQLIVVLGHTGCGAVTAAVNYVADGKPQPGHMQHFVDAIAPAARAVKDEPGDWITNAVYENIRHNVATITARSEIVANALSSGQARIVGALYNLATGEVTML